MGLSREMKRIGDRVRWERSKIALWSTVGPSVDAGEVRDAIEEQIVVPCIEQMDVIRAWCW